jgi:acetolactate synthase-1/2/3 large subunit
MGFGLPAAIGAKVGSPEKIVVDIDGDASFSMTAMELATASQYNIGVKVLLMNNEFQGMVEQWQGTFPPTFVNTTDAQIYSTRTDTRIPE